MRVSLDWLAEWTELPDSTEELCDRLTFAGLEIESVERTGVDAPGVRVGQVLECGGHPNADRLSLCVVDHGEGPVDIVCGAPNVAAGQRVAVAPTGTRLPDGTKLKKSKIRGVTSHGMICSERELGLSEAHEGILVLDTDAPPGTPLADVLPPGDTVLDVEITPNRGDWASMLGIAREVRAHFSGPLRVPEHAPREAGAPAGSDATVRIERPEGCYRYLARLVRGATVGASPDWLVRKLEAAGLRPINNVVDVTNLVLLEFGQPLHAFDLATLRGREVCVRAASAGEKIATLDGQMRELDPADLVIADAERAVAVAGVMGGAETEVRPDTHDILIECAHFDPSAVRRTARRLGLHTDSSYRFERGIDVAGLERAIGRAAHLIAELAGGTVAPGVIEARGGAFPHADQVQLDPAQPNRLLGTSLSTEEMVALLARVDIEAVPQADGQLRCQVPSYRNDVAIAEDLIEEIARVYGYDRLPETLPSAPLLSPHEPARRGLEEATRDAAVRAGLCETRTFPGTPPSDPDLLRLPADDVRRRRLPILNPPIEDWAQLRTTLLPSLLRAAQENLSHGVGSVRLFEVACQFRPGEPDQLPSEPLCVAGVVADREQTELWRQEAPLFFVAKGAVETLLGALGYPARFRSDAAALEAEPYLHPGAAAEVFAAGLRLGVFGELHPEVAAAFELDVPCAVFELELEGLVERQPAPARYREVSRYPAARRDVAVLVDRERAAGELIAAIRESAGEELISVDLFDRYEGAGIPEEKVSLAFRLVFQKPDRTLTDAEVAGVIERVREMLVQRFGGQLR